SEERRVGKECRSRGPPLQYKKNHNDKSVHGVLNPTYQAGLRRDAVQPDIEAERKREMRLRLGKVTVADVLAAQPVTTNLLKFMRASIKMIGVSNLQSFIAFFFFQAEDGIRDLTVTGVQTCALPI